MNEAESTQESALHNHTGDGEPHAQPWRAHTRDSVPQRSATVIDITERSRQRIADRWGKPIEEPPSEASCDPDQEPGKLRDAVNQLHLWRDPSPSLRAVWHDLKTGGARTYEEAGLALAVGYWILGIPGFAIVVAAELVKTSAARPGRLFASLIVSLLIWGAMAIAGINPFL